MVRLIVYRNYENFGEKKFVYDCTNREVIFFFFFLNSIEFNKCIRHFRKIDRDFKMKKGGCQKFHSGIEIIIHRGKIRLKLIQSKIDQLFNEINIACKLSLLIRDRSICFRPDLTRPPP